LRQPITLTHLEQTLPEGILDAGERYFQEGRVEQLREVDRHLWQARVRMEDFHELEVLLRGNRVQAFSCDCTAGQRKKPCSHLVAMLLLLRRYLDQRKEKRRSREPAPPPLTIPALLPLIPAEALHQFIREWAGKDPDMALALKARFFHRRGNTGHLSWLQRLFEPWLDEQGRLETDQGSTRKITLIFEQVNAQLAARIEEEETPEVFQLAEGLLDILERSHQVRHRALWIRKVVQTVLNRPEGRSLDPDQPRFAFLLHNLGRLFRIAEEESVNRVLLELQAYAGFEEARERIKATCGGILRGQESGQRSLDGLLLVYYQQLRAEEKAGPWLAALQLPRLNPGTYQKLAMTLLEAGDFEEVEGLLREALLSYPHHLELLRLRAKALWELHRWEDLPGLSLHILSTGLHPADLAWAVQHLPPQGWQALSQRLQDQLEALPSAWERNQMLAALHKTRADLKALSALIGSSQSLRLWRLHASFLRDQDPALLLACSQAFLEDYLVQHLGPQASATTQEILAFLDQSDRGGAARLRAMLRLRFPERPQLVAATPLIQDHLNL
jgi:hypothetical protein